MADINDHLVLACGKSATGKSASLMGLKDPAGVMYLNCESGKRLPFKAQFIQGPDGAVGFTIIDPFQIPEAFEYAETQSSIHTIVVDSLTYMMDMYESVYVVGAVNGMKAWGEFAQFFKKLMQITVAKSTKNVVFTAHTLDIMNDAEMAIETYVPIKGSLKNNGVESYFSSVIATKKMPVLKLEKYKNDLLVITEEEEALGFKYVFQTKLTKETVGERIRGPLGMFSTAETFIDNNMQLVFDRLKEYYA